MTTKQIVLLGTVLGFIVGIASTDLYLPSLPAITHELSANHAAVKLTLASYLFGFAVSQLVYGPLADSIGRKKTLIIGYCISIVGCIVIIFSFNIDTLIIGRLIQGAGIGAAVALGRALVRDILDGKDLSRAAAFLGNFTALVPAFAPVVGGYIQQYFSWHINFVLLLGMTLIAFAFVIIVLPETLKPEHKQTLHPKRIMENYINLLTHKKFMLYSCCTMFAYAALFGFLSLSPFLFQNVMHYSPSSFGWMSIFAGAGLIIGSRLNLYLLKYFEMPIIIRIGSLIIVSSALLMFIPYLFGILDALLILIPFLIFAMGIKVILANSFTCALSDFKHIVGTAGALYGALQFTGCMISTGIAAAINAQTQLPIAVLFFVCGSLVFVTASLAATNKKYTAIV